MVVVPSILSNNKREINLMIKQLEAHTKAFHLDICDNTMTKTNSSYPTKISNATAHLMTKDPISHLKKLKELKIKKAFIHAKYLNQEVLDQAKKNKITIGIALSPNENPNKFKHYIAELESVLVLTVKPGKYNSKFLPKNLQKIDLLRSINKSINITIDGGINEENIQQIKQHNPETIIVGSAIQNAKNKSQKLIELNKPTIYITRKIPQTGIKKLQKHANLIIHPLDTAPTQKELLDNAKKSDAIISLLTENIDKKFIKKNTHLKLIANFAMGFNNIDLKTAKKYNIPVSNTPGNCAATVADHAMALLTASAHRLIEENEYTKKNKYKCWSPTLFRGEEVNKKTIGLIGFGAIGKEMAKRANGFDMKILFFDHIKHKSKIAKQTDLKTLLKESDYISIHTPLLPSTHHLIGEKELKAMKKTSTIINTARGPIINESELIKALEQKEIAAAALDVFESEPCHNQKLNKMKNVILTPHVASSTKEARDIMANMAADNIIAAIKNQEIPNQIKL